MPPRFGFVRERERVKEREWEIKREKREREDVNNKTLIRWIKVTRYTKTLINFIIKPRLKTLNLFENLWYRMIHL